MLSLFVVLSLLLWTRARESNRAFPWFWFGVATGLAVAVKYSAAPLLLFLPLNARLAVAIAGAAFGFLLGNPEALASPAALIAGIRWEAEHYRAGHIPYQSSGSGDANALWCADYLVRLGWGWVPCLFAAAFLIRPRVSSPAASRLRLFIVAALVTVALPTVRFERNLEIALPALALAAAWRLEFFRLQLESARSRWGNVFASVAILLATVQSAITLGRYRQVQRFQHSPLVALPVRAREPDVLRLPALAPPPANWEKAPALVISAFTDPWSVRGLSEWTERLKGWEMRMFDSPWRAHGYPFSTVEVYHGPARVLYATPPGVR
jgi:hypothetical protein